MPRAKRSPPRNKDRAIDLFAEHHILDVRLGKRGQVQKVKHVQFGWIEPEVYYQLQKAKELLPLILPVIEGGYRVKAALWGLSVSIAGYSLPLGAIIPLKALLMLQNAISQKDAQGVLLWSYAIVGPYGDVLTLLQLMSEVSEFAEGIFITPEGNINLLAVIGSALFGPLGLALSWLLRPQPEGA